MRRAPKSVGALLSVALLLVVAGALGLVWMLVVPSLENRLDDERLSELRRAAPQLASEYRVKPNDPDFLDQAANRVRGRVVIFKLEGSTKNPIISVFNDSAAGEPSDEVAVDPIAARAAHAAIDVVETGTLRRGGERHAEAAVRFTNNGVLLLSSPLVESEESSDFVGGRLLVAGLIALAAALLVGHGLARMFARRLRRLERAADRIASGQFDEPVVDSGRDEVGELARAFERMRRRLAQLDHARREFVANASHELRTPLFALSGGLELLDEEELDEPTRREFVTTMRQQVERLTKLASELLDLSRLDAGRLGVEPEPLDLTELAETLAEEFGPLARTREQMIAVETNGPVEALGDEQRVLQIGRALVENALLHTPAGTQIRVATEAVDGRGILRVTDDGPGIPPEHTEHVFQRFYRIDGGRASGSGLGLAIARELAIRLGGTLELRDQAGETVFVLALPRPLVEQAEESAPG